ERHNTLVSHFPIMPAAEQQHLLQAFNATEHPYPH
ncbi:hypothetical protein PSYJA_46691, partial [Pseudomonas syringae pv. japonica str. M301072]